MSADDPLTVEDLFLAVDLERLGSGEMADEIRSAKSHEDVACLVMSCCELLEHIRADDELLELIVRADEANLEAWRRREDAR